MLFPIATLILMVICANMAANFISDAVRESLLNVSHNVDDELDACVGGQGPFDTAIKVTQLKDARVDHPYRMSQEPTPIKPSIRERVEKDNYASTQALATLDVADAIRELAAAIREKK